MSTTTTPEVCVPAYLEPALRARESALAKRCKRLGLVAPVVEVLRRFIRVVTDELGFQHRVAMLAYVVRGEVPRLAGGWQVVASVEHHATGNIVSVAPYFRDSAPSDLLHAPATCDHCGHNRARKFTVVVRDEAGTEFRVGKSCLRDFTGHDLPAVWETFADDLSVWDDELPPRRNPSVFEVVALAFAVIRAYGWASANNEHGYEPTASRVRFALSPAPKDECVEVTGDDYARAGAAIDWVASTTDEAGYLANLRSAVLAEATDKHLPLIVSLARAYDRHLEAEARDAERAREREAEVRVPCLTGRIVIVGKVVSTDAKDNGFGVRYVMTVRDDRGFTVWGTEPSSISVSVGDRVEFTATVERSDRDECFGFFSRPSKAQVLATAE